LIVIRVRVNDLMFESAKNTLLQHLRLKLALVF
jgi:hypothetical protein